ncbi:DUF11 domain-containing protein, partial [Methanobrevibacter filiformis]|uniref:DUF11 domain-containing protein n=1 Tax=Methanobrevibacter filiformis TaxID=55758 RepID=UPI000B2714D1
GAGETVALSITVVIIGNGTVTNIASVSVDQNNTNEDNGSDNETINVSNNVNVSVVKVSNTTGSANIGDVITYTITVSNNGSGNATGVYVTDVLNNTVLSFVSSNGSYDNVTGVWTIGSLGAGETVALSITVVIIGNGTVINTASVTVDQNNTNTNNGSDNETINVTNNVNVSVVKVSNTTGSANIGDTITYTITVTNNGSGNATGVFVTDLLNTSVLSFVGSNGSYDDVTGVWSIGSLGAGETVALSITVVIIGNGTVINIASVSVDQNNTNTNNGSDNETINVSNNVNVSVVKVSNTTGSANIGDIITYTITVSNNGSGNATGVYVTDVLNTTVLSFVSSNGSYDNVTGVWSIGDLGAGENVALSIIVVVIGNGTVINTASVSVDQNNTNTNNGSDNETIIVSNNVNVSVVKVSNTTGSANIGDIITYTITVSNNGSGNATGVFVTDVLNTTVLSFVSSNGSYDNNNGVWTIGDLGAGETVALSITVVVIGNGTVINTASVSVDQNNTNTNNGSDNETINVNNNVNVSVVKVSNTTGSANIGDIITYTITVTNNGSGNATGVYVTDVLNTTVLSFVSSNGSYDNVTGVWSIGDLGAGESVALSITVVVIGNGTVINTASVSVDQNNTNTNNGSDNETINVSNNVNVSVVKVSNTTGVANIGDIITYTITVSNNGFGNATGVYVTDLLNTSVLSFVGSNGSYDNNTGVWTIGSLGAGESVALSITVVIIGNGTVINIASVSVDQNNTNVDNGSDNETIIVSNNVNVSVVKVSNATGAANIGDVITYTIIVFNNGSGNATGVFVTDLLNASVLSFVGSNGSYDNNTGIWTIGSLGAGETVALSITVVIIGNGTVINTASVSVDQNNTNVDNGSDNETIIVSNNVNVSVVKVSNTTGSANIGDFITYTITVINNGSGNATGVYVTDMLNTTVLSFVGSNGSYDNNTGIWTIGSLGAGESVALSITVVIIGNGTVINTASVSVDQNNTNVDNGSDNETTNVSNNVNVSVVKVSNTTGSANIGDIITYTITVSNNGFGNATGVYVTDVLNTSVLSFVGSNGSYDNNTGVWSIGDLGAGESVALSITVVIIGNGTVINTASVSVDQNNTNVDNGSDNETIIVSNNVNVSVVKVSNTTGSANIGDTVTYTITVSNNGSGNATGVFVTDVLNNTVLSFVSSNGSYDNNTGVWTIGDLGAGESVALSITVVIIGNGTVTNTASVSVDQNNTNTNNGSDNETIDVSNNVNVSVVKVSNTTGAANIGDTVTYTITVSNNGSGNATGVFVTDLLNNTVLSFVGSNGSYDNNTGVWTIGSLGAGESVALSITVVIIGNGTVINTASVTVDQNNTNKDNGSDNETINVSNNVNVSVVKVSNTTGSANIGDFITYTITVSNNGSGNATGVYVTDVLNATVLSFVGSNGSYDNVTGVWSIGDLGAGESVALSITVVIIGNGTVINTASVSVDQNNTNVDNGSDNETINVSNNVNVSVVKVSNTTGTANIGDFITYTITVSNNGSGNATGVYVTDVLNATVLSFVGSNGSYDNVTGVWSIGDLGAGESVALSITVVIIGNGTVINTASVSVDQNNTNVDNGSDNETINVSNNVNVSVVKVSNTTGSANIGDFITYTITVSNNGFGNATGVYVTDVLNASVLSFVGSNGSYDDVTGVWSIGSLGAGETVALSITVVIIGNGTVINTASVTVDQNNTNTNNGSDNETINVSNNVNVSVVKVSNTTGTANIGDIIIYTITVTNNGSGNATGVYVTDVLNTSVLSFVGSNGSYDNVTGVWSIGDLGAGETVALNITVVIIGNGTVINTASVTVDQNNTNVDNGSDNETINVSNNVNVGVVKVSNTTGTANIGDIIIYTITVANNGSGNATGVYVTDVLNATVLSFVGSNGSYDNVTGVWSIGDLGAGESVALSITVVIIGNGTVINTASVTVDQNNTNEDNGSDNETINVNNNVN